MNLQFIHPGVLFGLLACAIPIIIHLLFKRRFKRLPWAAMKFLLAAYKKTKTNLLIEHLLLLLLRILLIILLVFVFARPVARLGALIPLERSTENFVIVLDNSYSMGLREANISPFEKSKRQGRAIFARAQQNDTITLLTMNEQPRVLLSFESLSSENRKAEILQKFESIQISDMATDVTLSLEMLKEVVQRKEYLNKNVFIISDFQKNAWQKALTNSAIMENMRIIQEKTLAVTFIDVGVPQGSNLGISQLEVDGVVGVGQAARFVATVQNFGSRNYNNVAIDFYVDGNKSKSERISIKANEQQKVIFYYTFLTTGNHHIMAELTADFLPTDNRRYLSFDVIDNIRTLIIDGDPQEGLFESESDYLVAAIGHSEGLVQVHKVDINALAPNLQFRDFDVIVLANLQTFDNEERFIELEEFVNKGGGVFIWLGEKVPFQYYNQELYKDGLGILPGEIVGAPIGRADDKDEKTVFNLDKIDDKHRLWRYFNAHKRLMEDLRQVIIYRFFPVKIDREFADANKAEVQVLAAFNDPIQYPFLVERRMGNGKVILATTTADREWNSFHSDQFAHVFLIMVYEVIQYLVASPLEEQNLEIGQPILLDFDYFVQDASLTDPDGGNTVLSIQHPQKNAEVAQQAQSRIDYRDNIKAGIYTLRISSPQRPQQSEADKLHFAVNVNAKEGNIATITAQQLLKRLKPFQIKYLKDLDKQQSSQAGSKHFEYWKPLLLILALLALLESFLAMRFGRYEA